MDKFNAKTATDYTKTDFLFSKLIKASTGKRSVSYILKFKTDTCIDNIVSKGGIALCVGTF